MGVIFLPKVVDLVFFGFMKVQLRIKITRNYLSASTKMSKNEENIFFIFYLQIRSISIPRLFGGSLTLVFVSDQLMSSFYLISLSRLCTSQMLSLHANKKIHL